MRPPVKIDRARWWALSNTSHPSVIFYGSLAAQLVDVMDSSIPTAATDGKRIMWSPAFVESLTDEETRFVLLHEALHCAHAHFDRLPITPEGNMAGDYAINLVLDQIPGLVMPKGGLLDRKYANMAEEEILADIMQRPQPQQGQGKPQQGQGKPQPQQGQGKPQPQQGQGKPQPQQGQGKPDPGQCGGFVQPDTSPSSDGQTLREKWERAVIQAEITAKALGHGDAPADLQRVLERVRASEVNWKPELADFARTVVSERTDWSRSTRRMATQPVIYPRRMRDQLGTIAVIRDTSGSIDNDLCAEFSAQVTNLCSELRCGAVVIDCDTTIHAEYRVEPGDECPLDAKGGGGTAFAPAFARIQQLIDEGESIAGLIYLTDLDGEFPFEPAQYPVLWAAYNTTAIAPFGRTIHLKK